MGDKGVTDAQCPTLELRHAKGSLIQVSPPCRIPGMASWRSEGTRSQRGPPTTSSAWSTS